MQSLVSPQLGVIGQHVWVVNTSCVDICVWSIVLTLQFRVNLTPAYVNSLIIDLRSCRVLANVGYKTPSKVAHFMV